VKLHVGSGQNPVTYNKYGDCLKPFKCHDKGEQPPANTHLPAIDLSLSELLPWPLVLRGAGSLAVTVPPEKIEVLTINFLGIGIRKKISTHASAINFCIAIITHTLVHNMHSQALLS